ncbi:hypothetical protein RvY_06003 [Ramazzottius varieornatus]|uniref:Uncharacterized protein n=1 Tax=Ramazzottius varieornatus TaxID=947166 RepID=A0A1D1V6N3_RAMVA|nr:hypothetical protein RvY_06003 [Ramazzottius varieornatus]
MERNGIPGMERNVERNGIRNLQPYTDVLLNRALLESETHDQALDCLRLRRNGKGNTSGDHYKLKLYKADKSPIRGRKQYNIWRRTRYHAKMKDSVHMESNKVNVKK